MIKSDKLLKLSSLGQSIWYDNLSRELLNDGSLKELIATGILGLTSNPAIFEKAISSSDIYDNDIRAMSELNKSDIEIYEELAVSDIQSAADLLFDTYISTDKIDGLVSLEVNPHLANNTQGTILEAKRLFKQVNRPNLMIKVPATPEGIPAIEHLIGEGISVNVTLIFSLESYKEVVAAYLSGISSFINKSGDPTSVASVASIFVGRVDTAIDKSIEDLNLESKITKGFAGVANAISAYNYFKESFSSGEFNDLASQGVRVQRPLWASTAVKNPDIRDVFYVEELIGPNTVNTLPDATLDAFMDHGVVSNTIDNNILDSLSHLNLIENSEIDLTKIMDDLLSDGVKIFSDAFDQLIDNVSRKRLSIYSENL